MALTPDVDPLFAELGIDLNTVSPGDLLAALNLFIALGSGGRRSLFWLAQNATDAELDAAIGQLDRAVIRALFQMRRPRIV